MAAVLKEQPFRGEQWDTPPKDPQYSKVHKLVAATGEIGEPAIRKLEEYLEEYPDELEAIDGNKWTPLMYAANKSTPEVIQMLVDYGAELDVQSGCKNTALMIASHYLKDDKCKVLIDAGADLTIKNKYGFDAFSYAVRNPQILELLNNAPNNPIRAKALQRRHTFSLDRTSDPSYYMTVDI